MDTNLPTPREIEMWVTPTLNHVIGCEGLRAHCHDLLRVAGFGPNTFVFGDPGTGKTACIKAYVRTLRCQKKEPDKWIPCGFCESCKEFDVRYSDEGLFATLRHRVLVDGADPLHYYPINCGKISESELRRIIDDVPQWTGLVLIWLDEVHRIVRRGMDHLLLKPLEELNAVWIASTAHPKELDRMFKRRFAAKVRTTLPTLTELVSFLKDRCDEWGIRPDSEETLQLAARRAKLVTADAIALLAVAAGRDGRLLDRELVARHQFDCDED
jgi:replication-associated recombination protein RarA